MSTSDTTMWRIERDPALRTTIVGVTVLDAAPEWAQLRHRLVEVTDTIPRLRQRVAERPFGLGAPKWVDDDAFDIDFHLRRVVVPGDADTRAMLDIAGPIAMAAFDKARPLWEFTLVEGMQGGQAALIQKIHHSMTDGIGAIRMARLLFDEIGVEHAAVPVAHTPRPDHDGEAHHDGVRLVLDSMVHQAQGAFHTAEHMAEAMPGAVAHAAFHPLRTVDELMRTTRSVVKLVRPVSDPLSPVMRNRGLGRRLAAMDFSLEALKESGHAVDGTLNDAFLAAMAGGMRRYHARHGEVPPRLRVTMPINQRKAGDAEGSNKFTPVRFELAIDVADPRQRMQMLGKAARVERREPGLKFTDQIAGVLNALPPQMTTMVLGSMLKAVDFVATNVPGLTQAVELAGAPVRLQYAFAPPSGAAFSAGLLSYRDACTLGLVMDTTAIHDPDVLAECMAEGFAEVLAVGAVKKAKRERKAAAAAKRVDVPATAATPTATGATS